LQLKIINFYMVSTWIARILALIHNATWWAFHLYWETKRTRKGAIVEVGLREDQKLFWMLESSSLLSLRLWNLIVHAPVASWCVHSLQWYWITHYHFSTWHFQVAISLRWCWFYDCAHWTFLGRLWTLPSVRLHHKVVFDDSMSTIWADDTMIPSVSGRCQSGRSD